MVNFIVTNFCSQAKVYLIIAFISLIYYVSVQQGLVWIIIKAILFIMWAFLLNKLCLSGNKAISWILAIIPHFIFLLFTVRPSQAKPSTINTFSVKN